MEKVTLNQREQNRLQILNEVNRRTIGIKQAAGLMGISIRHTKRLLSGYRQRGAEALTHGNRGRLP